MRQFRLRMWRSGIRFTLVALPLIIWLVSVERGQNPGSSRTPVAVVPVVEDTNIALPESGTMDERPFLSTRRNPLIAYDEPTQDVVEALGRKVQDGSVELRFDQTSGYLLSVLQALNIPVESQSMVFSKTSLQSHYINPSNPRALFFSDEVSVGFIRNAPLLEIAVLDQRQGVVFYVIEQRPAARPLIARSDSCLSCHESRNSLDVPGLLARSMGVGTEGQTMPQFGNYVSDHRSPFEERWGGWFVTGKTGSVAHMGNVRLSPSGDGGEAGKQKTLESLEGQFDLQGYPSKYSDVAAVMVLNHQVRMTNLLTRVGWETRIALDWEDRVPQDRMAAERLLTADAAEIVDYMLFVDEIPLPSKFESTSAFPAKFAAIGPADRQGHSLRELDLSRRLFRYPCSYMIYSKAFDALPGPAKDAVFARLWSVLSGEEKGARYASLSSSDRAAIVSILLDTKPNLPPYFKKLL